VLKKSEMAEQVKLIGSKRSTFSIRVEIALRLKGVQYEFVEEDLSNKSDDLLKYNPVHKKVPVLVHNGKPIAESTLIVEYIDEAFEGPSILPEDPYERANARFWAKFLDDKLSLSVWNAFRAKPEEQGKAIEETEELLKVLENQLEGKKFFGGDRIGLVDIVADFLGYWLGIFEEVMERKMVTKEKFPKLSKWIDDFVSCSTVKECLPPRDFMLETFRSLFKKA
jgi:glutathione S-transferase